MFIINEPGLYRLIFQSCNISHVRLVKGQYLVADEAKPDTEVAYDTETLRAIGRVRAVVREIG
jgi:hypothetical protein